MEYRVEDYELIRQQTVYDQCLYDISNNFLSFQLNQFSITQYALLNKYKLFVDNSMYLNIELDGQFIHDTEISMIAKEYRITSTVKGKRVEVGYYCNEKDPGIVLKINYDGEIKVNFGFSINTDAATLFYGKRMDAKIKKEEGYRIEVGNEKLFITSDQLVMREQLDAGFHFSAEAEKEFILTLSNEKIDAQKIMEGCRQYTAYLKSFPAESEFEKYYIATLLNTSLSMYKELGEFKGFFAGINYQSPARTYYRDGYYTVLPLLFVKPELVKEQIKTLYYGLDHGKAPSAIITQDRKWWDDHYDSGLYLIKLVYDYVCFTQDISVVDFDALNSIIEYLKNQSDSTGLIYKDRYHRRDWCDNIYRHGYSSYINILYYQAVKCLNYLTQYIRKEEYDVELEAKLKKSVNEILFVDGSYVNYKDGNKVESNLAIETVWATLCGLCEDSLKYMKRTQSILQTNLNDKQPFGDWGVMCVYPPYQYKEDLVEKSSYDYVYHNGSDWPYLSGLLAYALQNQGMNFHYPMTRFLTYGLEQGWNTPVEYYNPITGCGSFLQGWSAFGLFPYFLNQYQITYDVISIEENIKKLEVIYANRV